MPGAQVAGLSAGLDLAALAALVSMIDPADIPASRVVTGDEVEFHPGKKIALPQDMSFKRAREILTRVEEDQETPTAYSKSFKYRPNDGAVAAARVMKRKFGIAIGEGTWMTPPQTISVPISVTETVEVPWHHVSIPALKDTRLTLHSTRDKDYGVIFRIDSMAPKKYGPIIKEFYKEVEQELKDHSIYRGKAIVGTESPEFLDMSGFRAEEIVFAGEAETVLEGTIWSVLKYTDVLKAEGVKIKRAALLFGPYGCGKTSALQLTAQVAVANGWTYIKAHPEDDVNEVMRLARLYSPAVCAIEDIDNDASTADGGEVSKLLETFDGITAKGSELVVVMTTNHLERIHKGMLRPGRLDSVIDIGELDEYGVERLIKAVVAKHRLADDVNYGTVYGAMQVSVNEEIHSFYPAFVREAVERAKTVAIGRAGGQVDYLLDTEALRVAATSLQPQMRVMIEAEEGEQKPVLDTLARTMMTASAVKAVHGSEIVDEDNDFAYKLVAPGMNGHSEA